MSISMEDVKKLRDNTGVSIMQCKKALEEAEGDMEKAIVILRKKSSAVAAKKADRETGAGTIVVASNDSKAIILDLLCETDFVAKNEDFQSLANDLAQKALSEGIDKMKEEATSIIEPMLQKLGENIQLGLVEEFEGNTIGSYVHNGLKGAVVSLENGTVELAKDIAMHISAMRPTYLKREDVPQEAMDKAKEIFEEEVAGEDKPEDIKAKILEGKISSYFKEQTLLDQSFIKDPSKTISQLLKENGDATIKTFSLHLVG